MKIKKPQTAFNANYSIKLEINQSCNRDLLDFIDNL